MTRLLVLSHRYLGIAICLLFILWFGSGFVIMYTGGMPALSESERLSRLPEFDINSVSVSPAQARRVLGATSTPKLTSVMGRPAYAFPGRSGGVVFADSGEALSGSNLSSRSVVAAFTGAPEDSIERVGRVTEVDQWTIGLRSELPLEKFRIEDGRAGEAYVSPRWGQVLLYTSRDDRFWAWLGAIPHWLYFVDLRRNAPLWNEVVTWLAGLGTLLTALGLVMVFTQLRRVRPFTLATAIPYRGMARWHYLSGLMFGLVTLTWVFSGMLSVEPWAWSRPGGVQIPGDTLQGGAVELDSFSGIGAALAQLQARSSLTGIREIGLQRIQGRHYYRVSYSDPESHWGHSRRLFHAASLEASSGLLHADAVTRQLAGATAHAVVATELLLDYDNYYYSRRSAAGPAPPLPVLRVVFDDPQASWFYVDLKTGELVARVHRWGRLDRWLYNGLHSLDFGFLYSRRPLWDLVVMMLLAGGLLLVVLGSCMGFRRLYRGARRSA